MLKANIFVIAKCPPHYAPDDGLNITAFSTSHTNAVVNPTCLSRAIHKAEGRTAYRPCMRHIFPLSCTAYDRLIMTLLLAYHDPGVGGYQHNCGTMSKVVSLRLGGNQLSGAVPAAQWKGMTSLRFIYLWRNSQLSGCLPAAWKGRVNVPGSKDSNGDEPEPKDAYGPDSGTKITGFCP